MIRVRAYLKEKLSAGKKPKGDDFADLIDSFQHKTEDPAGGGDFGTAIPFNSEMKFDGMYKMVKSLTAPVTFTASSVIAPRIFAKTFVELTTNGESVTFTGMVKVDGSKAISPTKVNCVMFWWDGSHVNYLVYFKILPAAWALFPWASHGGATVSGDIYTCSNALLQAAGKKIAAGTAGAARIENPQGADGGIKDAEFTFGLHTAPTMSIAADIYVYYAARFGNQGSGAFNIIENQVVTTTVAIPVGATHYALFADEYGTVTFQYSADGGDVFNVLHTYTSPVSTDLWPICFAGQNYALPGYGARIIKSPMMLNGE